MEPRNSIWLHICLGSQKRSAVQFNTLGAYRSTPVNVETGNGLGNHKEMDSTLGRNKENCRANCTT